MAVAISKRGDVEPFHAMDILAEANRLKALGQPIVSMAVGQPSDPAPLRVRDAAARALADGRIGYTDALGLATLRQAISAHYAEHYGVDVPPSRIAVTTGSSAAFNLAFLAMFDPGDRVAIAAPGYPAYRNIMAALGLEVVEIELAGAAYLHADHLREAHADRAVEGRAFRQPGQPDRRGDSVIDDLQGTGRDGAGTRHRGDLGRDLSPARLFGARRDGAELRAGRHGHQLLLEILLHDRLADRLDGAAGKAGAAGRADRAEPLHLAARNFADRRCRGVQRDSGTGGGQSALCLEPRTADAPPAGSSASPSRHRWTGRSMRSATSRS